MIYVTGDIHGDPRRFSSDIFPEGKSLTKEDYVIILGDFGLVWGIEETPQEKYWLNWLNDKPWTTLFIDGNHENYDRLATYPVEEWNGGKVQKIRPSVIHLMRGQIFDLQGYSFFVIGGASSHDIDDGILEIGDPRIKDWSKDRFKMFRINHLSWWKEELPSSAELEEGLKNLKEHHYKVDYILSHCTSVGVQLDMGFYDHDILNEYLEAVMGEVNYRMAYFGHYHKDYYCPFHRAECLYYTIRRIV